MTTRTVVYGIVAGCVGMCIISGVIAYHMAHADRVMVAFLDVGQGDAALIMQGTRQIVIDGGADQTRLLEAVGRMMPFWDRTIETVVATHPDADHIDGLIGIFTHYRVEQFWYPDITRDDSSVFTALAHARDAQPTTESVIPYAGTTLFLNHFTQLRVISPHSAPTCDTTSCDNNTNSIAALLTIGDTTMYFGGDLPSAVEDTLTFSAPVSVVKASHHGAKTSTSDTFLTATSPRDVVISVGAGNRYGHPHSDTLNRIAAHGARILRTDRNGTILYRCTQQSCTVSYRSQ